MEFKFDNSEKLLFEYFDELFDQYLHRKQREQVESFLMRLRYEEEKDRYIIVDGFHRYRVLKTSKRIYEREKGMLPVVVIRKDISNRMASTIRHNRARGTHNIELMCNIVAELDKAGMSDEWIMKNIGMDRDELLRLKQISGLAELFANRDFTVPDRQEEYMFNADED